MTPLRAARLAALIYEDWPDCERGVAALGYPIMREWDHAGSQAMLVANEREAALVFRGTEAAKARWRDVWSNIGVPVPWAGPGRVHSGYRSHFNRLRFDVVRAAEDACAPLHLVGHSMGGCLATLCAAFAPEIPVCLWTFGAPKALTKEAAAAITCKIRRYTNRFGFAPHWPPIPWLVHPAPAIGIDSRGWPGPVSRHSMMRYIEALQRLPQQEEIDR